MARAAGFFDHGPSLPPEHWEMLKGGREEFILSENPTPTNDAPTSPSSVRSSPLSIHIPSGSSTPEAAFAALEYLPMPVIVLGPLKTVILANAAMARLLCCDDAWKGPTMVKNELIGQTLSQVGIDMIQHGFPIWIDWENFLDTVGVNTRQATSNGGGSGETTPKAMEFPPSELSVHNLNKTTVHDIAVEVVVSLSPSAGPKPRFSGEKKSLDTQHQNAQMIISAWELDGMKHYTLSFTSQPDGPKAPPSISSRSVAKASKTATSSPHSSSSSVSERRAQYGSGSSKSASGTPSPSGHTPSFPPPGPPSKGTFSSSPSVLQKATRLRDALLNAMNVPCYALWRDESVGIPNEALIRLTCETDDDEEQGSDTRDFLTKFKAFTEDFSRPLTIDEFPIIQLVRNQQAFSHRRVGLKEKTGHARIFDLSGEPVIDQSTGEFLGGVVILKDVTEYMDTIAAQKELNAQQFSVITNMIPQMVWTATPGDGLHDWFSQRWYDYTGLTPEESLGEGWKSPFHPEDTPSSAVKWRHSLRTGEEYTTEYRCQRFDGQWRWMLGRARPLRDEDGQIIKWFGTCTDIHEAVEARETTRATQERLLQVLETAKVTLWTTDKESRINMIVGNTDWMTTEGKVQAKDMIGCKLHKLGDLVKANTPGFDPLDPFDPIMMQQKKVMNNILSGKSKEEALEITVPGPERWFRTRYLPLLRRTRQGSVEGEVLIDGVVGASVDITEIRSRERELRQQEQENSKLLANALAAKEASRMKSQFLANMSHEIRTPIAGVIGMSELILDTPLDDEQRECAENIQRSANGLLTVINDILDFSKVESGRLEIEEVQFNLSVVLKDVDKMLSFAAERKGLAYESDTEHEIAKDLRVLGDPGRLRQILQNLLSNSIKFTSEGRVTTSASIIKRTAEMLTIEFVVQDTGIGIDESVRSKLFQPFSQADSSTARRFGGSGLGLTISKNLVELMHGEIKLDSVLNAGTRASFWIPFKKAEYLQNASPLVELDSIPDRLQSDVSVSCGSSETRAGTPVSPPVRATRERLQQAVLPDTAASHTLQEVPAALSESERQLVHVLVVEDNQINQQIALKTIKKLKFSVNAVWNGKEALDYLLQEPSATHPMPDIILMDCQMPVLDGYGATRVIRSREPFANSPRLKGIPIVAMTASAIQGDKEKCQKAGMDDYLAKPVRPKLLEKMLVKWSIEGQARRKALNQENSPEGGSSPQGFGTENGKVAIRPGPSTLIQANNAYDDPRQSSTDSLDTRLDGINLNYETSASNMFDVDVQGAIWEAENCDKTMSLHDDKILRATADVSVHPTQHHFEDSERHAGTKNPSHALTHENMDKFTSEQDKLDTGSVAMEHTGVASASSTTPTGMKAFTKRAVESRYSPPDSMSSLRPSMNITRRQDSDSTVKLRQA